MPGTSRALLTLILVSLLGCGDHSEATTVLASTVYQVTDAITVPGSGALRRIIRCNPGDVATGGGYFLNTAHLADVDLDVEVFANAPITDDGIEGTGWDIGIHNKAPVDRTGFGYAVCHHARP